MSRNPLSAAEKTLRVINLTGKLLRHFCPSKTGVRVATTYGPFPSGVKTKSLYRGCKTQD